MESASLVSLRQGHHVRLSHGSGREDGVDAAGCTAPRRSASPPKDPRPEVPRVQASLARALGGLRFHAAGTMRGGGKAPGLGVRKAKT